MVQLGGISCPGGRPCNEDSVWWGGAEDRYGAVVADGLGGHGGGKLASETAAAVLADAFEKNKIAGRKQMLALYEEANQAVRSRQTPDCAMKTTCVSLFLEGDTALWAHLGDSRLYHFYDGQIVSCTKDHSVSQLAVAAGEITQGQIRFHEDRNRVLKALGADETARPDIEECRLKPGFHAFLLCSDGFWEYVLEGEMEIELSKAEDPQDWVDRMEKRLKACVAKMKKQGENDNYTAAALFFSQEGGYDEEKGLY